MSKNVKTYSEWAAVGRRVHKGAGASHFAKGIPYFRIDQTYDPKERRPPSEISKDYIKFKEDESNDIA
jgi:hypothetical protein